MHHTPSILPIAINFPVNVVDPGFVVEIGHYVSIPK
jgi:hypothetical protein